MSKRSEQLVQQFEAAVADLAKAIEYCTEKQWAAVCTDEGWTVAQTAQHVSGQFPAEMTFIKPAAEGGTMPNLTWPELNSLNEGRADKNAAVTKDEVLDELRRTPAASRPTSAGSPTSSSDRKAPLSLADGAMSRRSSSSRAACSSSTSPATPRASARPRRPPRAASSGQRAGGSPRFRLLAACSRIHDTCAATQPRRLHRR